MEESSSSASGIAALYRQDRAPSLLQARYWMVPLILIAVLAVIARFNFLLFHTLTELFAIIVAVIMFVVAWQTYAFTRNTFLMFLGIGYFWVACIDLLHTLAYKGMGVFPGYDEGVLATQLWLVARFTESIVLTTSVFFIQRALNRTLLFGLFALAFLVSANLVFHGMLPVTIVEGEGLTPFKIYSEYLIILVLLAGLTLIVKNKGFLERRILVLMTAAVSITIASELMFTIYVHVHDSANMIGHLFKFLSFWLVFIAVIRTNLTEPFLLLAEGSSTYEAIPSCTVVVDGKGLIRQANIAAIREAGLGAREMVGQSVHALFHDPSLRQEQCLICQHIQSGIAINGFDMEIDGRGSWREITITPVEAKNIISGMVHVSTDITGRIQAQQALQNSESKYRGLVENLKGDLFFYTLNEQGQCTYVSPSVTPVLGYDAQEFVTEFDEIWRRFDANSPAASYRNNFSLRGLQPPAFVVEISNNKNEAHFIELSEVPVHDNNGKLIGVQGIAYDITRQKRAETELQESNELLRISRQRLEMHVDRTPLAVIELDKAFNIIHWNPSAERIFGYKAGEILGHSANEIVAEPDREHVRQVWEELLNKKGGEFSKNRNVTKNGERIICEWYNTPIEDDHGNIVCIACLVNDVTAREQVEERLVHQANYDTLTQLPNRMLAFDRLGQAIKAAHRNQYAMAVLFVDIDLFKNVNDTLGHFVGDQLLIAIGERLQACVRDEDTVARLGGDEFLVILSELRNVEEAERVAEKVHNELMRPIRIDEREFHITASIGISGYPNDSTDPHVLLRNADVAMYQAKENGRNTFSFFTKEMNDRATKRLEMEAELRHAIRRKELSLNYQPQIEIRSNRIIGAEALLRWNSQKLGMVSPLEFIPIAEDTGLIEEIGRWVLETACRQAKVWEQQGYTDLRMSVNMSVRQLKHKKCLEYIREVVNATRLNAERLELELTESMLIDNTAETENTLRELKNIGVRLTLDDFGTGYSSLSYLKRYPFDAIKIDRSFVMDIPDDQNDIELCRAIIAIAESLNMEVVGEGAETAEQVAFLRENGTTLIQGYFYSKPLPDTDFLEFLKQHNTFSN